MKLNKLIYGVLTIFAFSSCADQMEYSDTILMMRVM